MNGVPSAASRVGSAVARLWEVAGQEEHGDNGEQADHFAPPSAGSHHTFIE
jgi:hypothetical protein